VSRVASRSERLVFLHGFTQTHHHWHRCAWALADRMPVRPRLAFVDLPGHGLAGADHRSIEEVADEIPRLGGAGTYVGYSMGGRHLLAAAVRRPVEIERIVVIGAHAGLTDAADRAARVEDDEQRARRVEEIGVEAFVDEWLAMPMFAGVPASPPDRRHRCRNGVGGLAASLRRSGTGAQRPVWDRLGDIDVPTLVLAGERDAKFRDIGERIAAAVPGASFAVIPGAGHAAFGEQPDVTADVIATWLAG
jgi:2-succinyl-6-hydroxy-2,4-cyclohexadiene-1-carboxylate synthase